MKSKSKPQKLLQITFDCYQIKLAFTMAMWFLFLAQVREHPIITWGVFIVILTSPFAFDVIWWDVVGHPCFT